MKPDITLIVNILTILTVISGAAIWTFTGYVLFQKLRDRMSAAREDKEKAPKAI